MTCDILFVIAYILGFLFSACIGYVIAMVQVLKARQKLFDCGTDFLKGLFDHE